MKRNRQFGLFASCGPMVLALALGAFMPGCDSESDETAAIRQARRDIEYLAAHGGQAPEGKGQSYEKIVSNLSKASSSSVQGEADAARLIRADANLRRGDLLAADAAQIEQNVLRQANQIRDTLNRWQHLHAAAAALTAYDPKPAQDELSKQAAATDAEIAKAAGELSTAQTSLTQLETHAQEALEKARAERTRESEFRTSAIDKSESQRADLITKANQASRAGDALDKTASELLAEAAKQRPAVDETKRMVDALRAQRALIDVSKGEIDRLVRVNAEQARKTLEGDGADRIGVKQLQESLTRQIAELDSLRDTAPSDAAAALDGLYTQAQQLYETAASEANKAKGSSGKSNTISLTVAGAKHAKADLLMSKARGLEAYASVLALLAAAQPALPGDYPKKASEAKAAYETTLAEARATYTEARGDYESAGNREQVDRIKSRLGSIAQTVASFDPTQPAPEAAPAEGAAADGTPPTADAASATPDSPTAPVIAEGAAGEVIATAQVLAAEARKPDLQAFMEHVVFRNDKQKEYFTKLIPLQSKSIEFSKACMEEFKRSAVDLMIEFQAKGGTFNAEGMMTDADLAMEYLVFADPSDLKAAPSPDNPEIFLLSSASNKLKDPLRFSKRDGAWKLMLDPELPDVDMVTDVFLQNFVAALEAMTAKVRSGHYAEDSSKVIRDLFEAMADAALKSNNAEPK